jgi:hypothetical protein
MDRQVLELGKNYQTKKKPQDAYSKSCLQKHATINPMKSNCPQIWKY